MGSPDLVHAEILDAALITGDAKLARSQTCAVTRLLSDALTGSVARAPEA